MIHITQLVYIKEGQEKTFQEFEDVAIPIISKYRGTMLLRLRPGKEAFISGTIESPYEIHLVSFLSQIDFENFLKDEGRKQFLHLKEKSIKSTVLIHGTKLSG